MYKNYTKLPPGRKENSIWLTIISIGSGGDKIIKKLSGQQKKSVNLLNVDSSKAINNIPAGITKDVAGLIIIYEEKEKAPELTEKIFNKFGKTPKKGLIFKDTPNSILKDKSDFLIKARTDEEIYLGVKALADFFGLVHGVCVCEYEFINGLKNRKNYEVMILERTIGDPTDGESNFTGITLQGFYVTFCGKNFTMKQANDIYFNSKGLARVYHGVLRDNDLADNAARIVLITSRLREGETLREAKLSCPICKETKLTEVLSESGEVLSYICRRCAQEMHIERRSGDDYKLKTINKEI